MVDVFAMRRDMIRGAALLVVVKELMDSKQQ
jgi:hypothetical protein